MSGLRRGPIPVRTMLASGLLLLAGLAAACGGGGAGTPVAAERTEPGPATDPGRSGDIVSPPVSVAEPEEEARPSGPVGAVVEVRLEDLPPGFDAIPFYADIPGLLRESADGNLASLGLRAAVPGFSGGQGFANNETGELIFVVTILLESSQAAEAAVSYIGTREVEEVMQFVEPTDTLFASERKPDPILGSGGVRYALRYGVEDDGRRARDVATELVVFGQDGSLVFLQRSVNVTGSELSAAGEETEVDLLALGRTVGERIAAVVRGEAAASP